MTSTPNPRNINQLLRAKPVSGRFGAPLGAFSNHASGETVLVQKIQLDSGGYAPDGTYWGCRPPGSSLWCAWAPDGQTMVYKDAQDRAEVIFYLENNYPGLTVTKVTRAERLKIEEFKRVEAAKTEEAQSLATKPRPKTRP